LVPKLVRLREYKVERGESVGPAAPLFCSQAGGRISKRRVQVAWHAWQTVASFDRQYGFHALRHAAVTNVYRASRDLFLAQRFARHASPLTTIVYTHPSDEELQERVRGLGC
jgi:site-specific recombinase XerC